MASLPPPYKSGASVSRSKTSRDEMRSMADSMLRSSLSRDVSTTSTASVSRSQASRDDMRALADSMLRSSLSGSTSSASSTLKKPVPAPSYRSQDPAPFTVSGPPSVRADMFKSARERTPTAYASRTRQTDNPSNGSVSRSTSLSGLSVAEAKQRVRQLQQEVERVNAQSPPRATAGMFKAACSTDLLFLIDTTGSMQSYIDAAKNQVKSIVAGIKVAFLNESQVRIAVVGYKDHRDTPNIQFLDFTTSADQVRRFLDTLTAGGGSDLPEDVLGGVRKALDASWKQQTRCIVHIADAPGHGRALHDLNEFQDSYFTLGSEPHSLTYEPLLRQLLQLNINYALLRINATTDRMALAFSQVYDSAGGDVKLLPCNIYYSQMNGAKASSLYKTSNKRSSSASTKPQFEEMQLGITYSKLQHLVVSSVMASVSRTTNRLSIALSSVNKAGSGHGKGRKSAGLSSNLSAIVEYDPGAGIRGSEGYLETPPPQWNIPGWLDETLEVEGFCPDVVVHSAQTLNDMMAADENIKLSVAQLTIYARSKPFAQGSVRTASYARTAASTSRFVVKSFIEDGHELVHVAEDMRIQALCKAFALEFNGLLKIEPPIDFIVTTCLQTRQETAKGNGCLSLEPFIEGDYVKYNSNGPMVKEDSPDDPFNQTAQAFSHFTFERSWGLLLVNDLQGVGNLLTDPAIQTRDTERFKLHDTNLNEEGFKFFFANHKCNSICRKLGLKSNAEMLISGNYEYRERWPTMDPTVCCSNKLCRRIVRLASAHESDKFPGYHWCDACWPQLQSSIVQYLCVGPGPNHRFGVSKFFHESQGQVTPRKCPEHIEKDTSVSGAAVVGGSLWSKMKSEDPKKGSISGRAW